MIYVIIFFLKCAEGLHWAWILDVMLIALVSNVTLLVWLSNFAQCWLPCVRLNPIAWIPWAPSTAQILKVTLIEWVLKLTLLALHQVFTPLFILKFKQKFIMKWKVNKVMCIFQNIYLIVKVQLLAFLLTNQQIECLSLKKLQSLHGIGNVGTR